MFIHSIAYYQKYRVYKHEESGDYLVRTTGYSLPQHLHEHVDVVQPTTSFGRFKKQASTLSIVEDDTPELQPSQGQIVDPVTGIAVDASCNTTITIKCLQQLYNAVGYEPLANGGNSFGITAYLEQYANIQDLQDFYREQRPDALGTNFTFVSIKGPFLPSQANELSIFDNLLGGINPQNPSAAGLEANLDTQFGYGLSFPTPVYPFSCSSVNKSSTNVAEDILVHRRPPTILSGHSYCKQYERVESHYYYHWLAC